MYAIIFVAGEGKRLRPLTFTTPKPLLELLGESIISRVISPLLNVGIKDFIFVTNYKEKQVIEHIKDKFKEINTIFIHQEKLLGTADALLRAKDYIVEDDEFFIAVNGDCLFSPSILERAVRDTMSGKMVLGGKKVTDPHNYGVIVVDENHLPLKIIEKPPKGTFNEAYANIGIYGLPGKVMRILEQMENMKMKSSRGEYELPDAINQLLDSKAYETSLVRIKESEYWFDIGHPWSLLEANKALMLSYQREIEGEVEENVTIKGPVVIRKGAIVRSGAYIEGPAFIDEGADVGPNCYIRKYTYLGRNTRIGNACEVKNSIIYDGTHAAHLTYIGDSIIGKNCNFGAGTITANLRLDDRNVPVVIKGIKVDSGRRKLGLICGDNVKTGISVLFMPGVKVGYNSWVGAGTVVNEDIPNETVYYSITERIIKRKKKLQ